MIGSPNDSKVARPAVIGIIGPPCSGKSTVAKILQSHDAVWINADTIAKEQLNDPDVIDQLVERFGPSIQQSDGTLSRPAIADLVFGDDAESTGRLEALEAIIHPRTRLAIAEQLAQATDVGAPIVVLDVPLLIESGWDSQCDEVWCLKIDPKRQADLLDARGWDLEELKRRQRRQLSWEEKERQATTVIVNDGTLAELEAKVQRMVVTSKR